MVKGQRIGRLVIVEELDRHIFPSGQSQRKFKCLCDCGNYTNVFNTNLRKNHTISCGCFNDESRRQRKPSLTHNNAGRNKRTSEYIAWLGIKQRCYNINNKYYKHYGQRGIVMCDRWLNSFENFLYDMGTKPDTHYSIDRIDVNGNYEPSNCRWATPLQQVHNRRKKQLLDEPVG